MARGWESKSVEEMREVDIVAEGAVRHAMTIEDLERVRRLESLQLARTRSLAQLESARNRKQRALFERAIAALDEQIREIELSA